jgi:hypothetical protein
LQSLALVENQLSVYFPPPQSVHAALPVALLYFPPPQGEHAL